MTAVTVVTAILGYTAAVIPTGEHPVNARCRRGLCSPFSARKATPAVRKIPRFFRLRLQGVTHYTLPCKEPCARRSLWTPLKQGIRPAPSCALQLRMEECRRSSDSYADGRGYPINAVTTVMTVTHWENCRFPLHDGGSGTCNINCHHRHNRHCLHPSPSQAKSSCRCFYGGTHNGYGFHAGSPDGIHSSILLRRSGRFPFPP